MAESIGLPLLQEVAKPMIDVVVNQVKEEIHSIKGFTKELDDLQEKIRIIAGIVDSMTDVPNEVVPWLRKTIRIIHTAEDLLDVLAYEEKRIVVMKKRPKKAFSRKIRLVFLPLTRLYIRIKMASWIRKINSDFEAVVKEARFIHGLRALMSSASSSQPAAGNTVNDDQLLQQVRQNVDTSLFVGRDADVASVVDKLLYNPARESDDNISCTNHLSVVAIVGFGGFGKTTLAKKVCENERVMLHFSERIWISESKDFNIEMILNKMAKILEKGNHKYTSGEAAIRKLEGHLGGKRYLLVLDDVWNTYQDLWDSMRSALERIGGSKDSMILTTTRDDAVAKTMHASVHPLLGLPEDASWLLFKQIAFANWSNGEALAFKATGRKIVKKCKGVPLVINSIAGILNNKRNPREWSIIEESELWGIRQDETDVLPSLKLRYNHLSPMLKKCFSLCAFCPKGWWFEKYHLICRWMALGLIQNSSNVNITMEDIGEEYVNELLSISFLLVKERNDLGEAVAFHFHDMVYDLARSVAMHERLYLEASKEAEALDIQHITVTEHAQITLDFPDRSVVENTRSLELLNYLPRGLLVHVMYLRVLYIYDSTVEVVPESIAKLKCLKFLGLKYTPIKLLPESIMELYNLQSLFLYDCKHLSRLPRGLSNLVNLRHLGLSFHFCPTEAGVIEQLSELQTLPPLQLSEGGFQISELGCLHQVKGTLDIKGLELIKSKLDAENSGLSTKSRVEGLLLSWDNDENYINHEAVLDGLHPNPNLKLLSIRGYGAGKFPSWLMRMNVPEGRDKGYGGTLCYLIKIKLIDCGRCQQLPTMGHLPMLKLIEIRNMENLKQIGPELYGDAGLLLGNSNEASSSCSSPRVKSMVYFESLKELQLIDLVNFEYWCEPAGVAGKCDGFPFLEVLVIEDCRRLKEAPNKFPSLKELIVKHMYSSKPLIKILRNRSSVSNLTKLEIVEVEELTHIAEVGGCTSLQTLIIRLCPKLESIPNLCGLASLRLLLLFRNDGLMAAPKGLESCKLLEELRIDCCGKVETLPDLSGLSRLRDLGIMGMSKMIRQPRDWVFDLPSLRALHIGDYHYNLEGVNEEFPDISCLLKMTALESLYVYGWEELQNIPEQLQHFTTLKTLVIADFEKVEQLPDWLGNLLSLQKLGLFRCKSLKKLPSKEALERLPNFSYLEIEDCPVLEQAVDRDGPEYHKIAAPHIKVEINSTS